MRNVQQIRTVPGKKTELTLIDGSKLTLNYFRLCVLAHELFVLGRHKEGLFQAIQNGTLEVIQEIHSRVNLEKNKGQSIHYRFEFIRLWYENYGGKYTYVIFLPNGIPLELDEAVELGEILREHARFFFYGPGAFQYSERVQKYLGEAGNEEPEKAPDADGSEEEDEDDVCLSGKEDAQSDEDCDDCDNCEECPNWDKEEKKCLKGWEVETDDDENGETETE